MTSDADASNGSSRGEPSAPYEFIDCKPDVQDMKQEVLAGLGAEPRRLSPKYFYDEAGSRLFERITRLPEYYPTRTEMGLFDARGPQIARAIGAGVCIVEYGSGSSQKIRKLLEYVRPAAYVPVDISGDHLQAEARALHADYPWLAVYPTCADITEPFPLPPPVAGLAKVGFFPGSSIGNFEPEAAVRFLASVQTTLGAGGRLLVGVDRKKDRRVLEAAYNDSAGVTAEFNRNLLRHINARLGADFDPSAFAHEAHYDAAAGCIQMFLRSTCDQQVTIDGTTLTFRAGERIHTENSFKYHPDEFLELARRAGFEPADAWTDERDWFALFLLRG